MLFSFRLYLCSSPKTSSESDRDPFCGSCHLAQDPLEESQHDCFSTRCCQGRPTTSVRGTEGKRRGRWDGRAGSRLLPSAASRLAAPRLFRFHITTLPIPDSLCSVPVARSTTAEWELLGRGKKVREMKRI